MVAIDHLKHFADLHYNVGGVRFAERRYGAAILCFQEAVRWSFSPAIAALRTVAEAAQQDATDAYNAGNLAEAAALCREAIKAAPTDEPIAKLGRAIAAHAYNYAVIAYNKGSLSEAADLFSPALELDSGLTGGRDPLAKSLRAMASAHFEAGRVQEALAAFDRLLALGPPKAADEALIHSVQSWLREGFARQVSEFKVGGAVYLLKHLAQLAPKTLSSDVGLIQQIGELSRILAKHASEQPIAVLDAVRALHPLAPSAQLAFAGAGAYKAAVTEAQRLHISGETLAAMEFCEPAMRYRPRGPDGLQLSHALATLLCRRVADLLENDPATAISLHERTLIFLEALRSPGIVAR